MRLNSMWHKIAPHKNRRHLNNNLFLWLPRRQVKEDGSLQLLQFFSKKKHSDDSKKTVERSLQFYFQEVYKVERSFTTKSSKSWKNKKAFRLTGCLQGSQAGWWWRWRGPGRRRGPAPRWWSSPPAGAGGGLRDGLIIFESINRYK